MKKLKIIILLILSAIIIIAIILYSIFNISTKTNNNEINNTSYENVENETIYENTYENSQDNIGDEEQSKTYFEQFKILSSGDDLNAIAQKINKEYLQAKFQTSTQLSEYLKNNKETWANAELDTYETFKSSDYTDFICKDKKQNYYIFRKENSSDNYTVILDIYTLDLKWLKNKINSSEDYNVNTVIVQKIINMINCRDYKTLYTKLSDNFKKSKFDSLEKFENFAKEHFKENTDFDIIYYETINDSEAIEIALLDTTQESSENMYQDIVIIIKAQNINNYIIAFEIQ